MVASESNRVQVPSPAPFERQAQTFQPPVEAVAGQRQSAAKAIHVRDPLWFVSLVVAGATLGSLGGLSALILAIVALSGVLPMSLLPVAGIVMGLAFMMLGAIGIVWARMFQFAEHEPSWSRIAFFSGMAAASIAGVVAVVLGILNFVFVGDVRFCAGAVVVLGLGLLWHSTVMRRVSQFTHDVIYGDEERQRPSGPFAVNALSLAPLRDFLIGLGAVIVGILAISMIAPVALSLVALLAMGGALALTASTICGATLAALPAVCAKG